MGETEYHRSGNHRMIVLATGAILAVALTACDRPLDHAYGDRNQIVIFADEANWELYGERLKMIFEREVKTPRAEYIFNTRNETLDKWRFFSRYYHLLLCGAISEDTPTADRIREHLSEEVERQIMQERRGRAARPEISIPGSR